MYKRHYAQVLVVLLICFVALLALFDYGARQEGANRENIQIILKARANPPDFWRVVEQGITAAAEEYGVDFEVTAPTIESDFNRQIQLVQTAIDKRPHAIILAACDYDRLMPVCKKAVEQGIILVTLDSDVHYDGKSCFVGTDNYEMGKKLASLVDEAVGPDGKFGVVAHVATTTTAVERRAGLLENLSNVDSRMVEFAYCEGSEEISREKTIAMLTEHPEIRCMIGLNETSALGAIYAIHDLGLQGQIPLVACDSSQKQIQYMERGDIQAFVVQNPFNMGYLSVQNTVKLLRGDQVPQVVHTDSVVIRKEDLYKKENQKLLFPFSNER